MCCRDEATFAASVTSANNSLFVELKDTADRLVQENHQLRLQREELEARLSAIATEVSAMSMTTKKSGLKRDVQLSEVDESIYMASAGEPKRLSPQGHARTSSTRSCRSCGQEISDRSSDSQSLFEDEGLGDLLNSSCGQSSEESPSSGPCSLSPDSDHGSDHEDIIRLNSDSGSSSTSGCCSFCSNGDGRTRRASNETTIFSDIASQTVVVDESSSVLVVELQRRLDQMSFDKANLAEQVLELEEAENDARLLSQRLQGQLGQLCEQVDGLQAALIESRAACDMANSRQRQFDANEKVISKQIDELRRSFESTLKCSKSIDQDANCSASLGDQLQRVDTINATLLDRLQSVECQLYKYRQDLGQPGCLRRKGSSSNSSDDEMEMFIEEDDMLPSGSSFEASLLRTSTGSNHRNATKGHQSLSDLTLPLCETGKPKKIDLLMCSPGSGKNTTEFKGSAALTTESSSKVNFSASRQLLEQISKFEANEQLLRDRLLQLEWINKEFVREMELREAILEQRQAISQTNVSSDERELDQLIVTLSKSEARGILIQQQLAEVVGELNRKRAERPPVRPPRSVSRVIIKLNSSDESINEPSSSSQSLRSSRIELFAPVDETFVELEAKQISLQKELELFNEELRSLSDQIEQKRLDIEEVSANYLLVSS